MWRSPAEGLPELSHVLATQFILALKSDTGVTRTLRA